MVYIDAHGNVHEKRPWTVSKVRDIFLEIINFIVLFFRTLINPDANSKGSNYTTDYRVPGRNNGNPPPRPRRRFGGFGPSGGAPSCPPLGGGGG